MEGSEGCFGGGCDGCGGRECCEEREGVVWCEGCEGVGVEAVEIAAEEARMTLVSHICRTLEGVPAILTVCWLLFFVCFVVRIVFGFSMLWLRHIMKTV